MDMNNNHEFLKKSNETINEILEEMSKLPSIPFQQLPSDQTAFVIVDMVNGFARIGSLSSPRVEGLIPEIAKLLSVCQARQIQSLAFGDSHSMLSPEFEAYPAHCLEQTEEAEVVTELKNIGGYRLIAKNSTNGFHEEEFQQWLEQNKQINTYIIAGDCTDLCVQQFAVTLKTWYNWQNKVSRIIVPVNVVETYDLGTHHGDLMHLMALYNMKINGIEIVSEVR